MVYVWMAASIPLFTLHMWAENKCAEMHWRWKIISTPAALLAAPGLVFMGAGFLALMAY